MNSLPKTVTRQRRDCDLNPGRPSAPESSTPTTRLPSHSSIYCNESIEKYLSQNTDACIIITRGHVLWSHDFRFKDDLHRVFAKSAGCRSVHGLCLTDDKMPPVERITSRYVSAIIDRHTVGAIRRQNYSLKLNIDHYSDIELIRSPQLATPSGANKTHRGRPDSTATSINLLRPSNDSD